MDDMPRGFDTSEIANSRNIAGDRARPTPPALQLTPGQQIGAYRLLDQVGAGGFSVVWRAKHARTGNIVAIKFPRVPEFVGHLRREALISTRFHDPQVVGITEVSLDQDPPYLVMPFIPGANLEMPDRPAEPKDIVVFLRTFRRITGVVARLHEAGFAHGDLKPGNIRFHSRELCYILDLGLARQQVRARQESTLRASVISVTGEKIAGTLEFMAPEVMAGERPDTSADVYALGVILHTLLSGRPPAFGVSPEELNPYLPPGMIDFLRQMLAAEPAQRIPSAAALLPIIDDFIRIEERCLRRRNGHARRLVFQRRMRTLGRGVKVLGWTALTVLFVVFGLPAMGVLLPEPSLAMAIGLAASIPTGFIGLLLGMTTLNAWLLGIPEKTYKNRRGHPLWTFMMQ